MKSCTKQYLCILVLAGSVLFLLYIYLAHPLKEGIKVKKPKINIKKVSSIAAPSGSKSATYKPCSSITGTQEECTNNYYGSGSGDRCIYDTANEQCIRPGQTQDESVMDDGTNAEPPEPEERINDIKEVDVKTGL